MGITVYIGLTFLDGLLSHLSENQEIEQETVLAIVDFMKFHQYDSDALREDISNQQSNLHCISKQNADFLTSTNHFIANIDCMSL